MKSLFAPFAGAADRHFLTELEDYFGCSFSDVAFAGMDDAKADGRLARTIGREVRLSVRLRYCPPRVRQLVVAHEVAHLAQLSTKPRPGRANPSVAQIECEAAHAAVSWLLGLPCPALSHASPARAYDWGPEGHYYTVYLLSLLCGVRADHAFQLAFYAQLPDQVLDLDATIAGERYEGKNAALLFAAHRSQLPGGRPQSFIDVQAALHCLTGRNGAEETALREKLLAGLPDISSSALEHGLAIHALGDSFAHRNGNDDRASTFAAPMGHFLQGKAVVEYVVDRLGAGRLFEDIVKLHLGAEVDEINLRPEMYKRYAMSLIKLLRHKTGQPHDPALIMPIVSLITTKGGSAQRDLLVGAIRKAHGMNPFTPEQSPTTWDAYAKLHPHLVTPDTVQRARRLLHQWSAPNRAPFGDS